MKNKKGIEVSVNFIVTLIIAIVVFIFGIYIANRIYNETRDIEKHLNDQTKSEILRVLTDTNQPFTIPINRFEISKGEHEVVGVGISTYGIDNTQGTEGWYISIEPSGTDNELITFDDISGWTFETKELTIEPNEYNVAELIFTVPQNAEKGTTYVFNVKVCKTVTCGSGADEQHGRLQKIYIKVK